MLAVATGVAAGLVVLDAEQRDSREVLAEKVGIWYSAIDAHVPGRKDLAVDTVAGWSRTDLLAVLNELKKTDEVPALNHRLKRAAMLHADVAMLNRHVSGYSLPPADRESAWYRDGELVSIGSGTVHWEVGRLILDGLKPNPSREEFVRLWYRATSAFLQGWSEHVELRPHLSRGLQIFPRDAMLLMYGGTMHEALAEPRVQTALQVRQTAPSDSPFLMTRTTPTTVQPSAPTGNATNERRTAEALFRRALEMDPASSETRIRLAYLLSLRGRHQEAVTEVTKALDTRLPPRMRYFAFLFLGRAQQALGQYTPATRAFENAALLFPGAQSAKLGLSQVARAQGNRDEAIAHLAKLSAPSNLVSREDPWREYNITHVPDVFELVSELRRSVVP
jgi:tetratricopeptide (TPR) repeat protein